MKNHYETRGIKNNLMQEAIKDSLRHGNKFFSEDTIRFWNSKVEYGMFRNNTFVTSEDNFDRSKILYTVRQYDWDNHTIETVSGFQQFDNLDDAIVFAKSYEGDEQ